MMKRRNFLAAAAGAPMALAGAGALAQSPAYPARTITLVSPYAAGGSGDTASRLVAHRMGVALGQQVVVDNRPGAGGVGAVKMVAGAAPDGYTLLGAGAAMAISQTLFRPQPYDLLRDFIPVSAISANDVVLIVRKDSKYKSMADFVQDAGKRRDAVMVGVAQLGTTQHLSAELFKARTGITFTIVPYKSTAALGNALMAGDVEVMFELTSSSQSVRQSGHVRSLAISSATRSEALPDTPTAKELGVSDFEVASWGMLLAPARTPDAVVQRLSLEVQRAMTHPDIVRSMAAGGSRILAGSPAQARDMVAGEISRWAQLIASSKIALK